MAEDSSNGPTLVPEGAAPAQPTDQQETPPPPAPPRQRASQLPFWVPYFLLAAVPALVAGLAVYFLAGGNGGSDSTAGIIDAFIRLGTSGDEIHSFKGQTPPGFPQDFPIFSKAKVISSFVVRQDRGASYLVLFDTSADAREVLAFYQRALDQEPWQVQVARASDDFTGIHFINTEDVDIEGDVTIHTSALGKKTLIFLAYEDLSPTGLGDLEEKPFVLGAARLLPSRFPSDIPIYQGKNPSTIIDTFVQRAPGSTNYVITFLTTDSQDDVVEFYRREFQRLGWNVIDAQARPRSFQLRIDFNDGSRQEVQGSVTADSFDKDAAYTQVNLYLQVSTRRGRGN
jgi:hypothetical protein